MKSLPLVNKPNATANTIFKPVPVDLPGGGGGDDLEPRVEAIEEEIGSSTDSPDLDPPTVYSFVKEGLNTVSQHNDVITEAIEGQIEIIQSEITTLQGEIELLQSEVATLVANFIPMTADEANAGLSPSPRLISPKVLADEIDRRIALIP